MRTRTAMRGGNVIKSIASIGPTDVRPRSIGIISELLASMCPSRIVCRSGQIPPGDKPAARSMDVAFYNRRWIDYSRFYHCRQRAIETTKSIENVVNCRADVCVCIFLRCVSRQPNREYREREGRQRGSVSRKQDRNLGIAASSKIASRSRSVTSRSNKRPPWKNDERISNGLQSIPRF